MSGPKCACYDVEENLQLQRFAVAQAWEAAGAIEGQLAIAERHADVVSRRLGLTTLRRMVPLTKPPQDAGLSSIETYIAALRGAVARLEEELRGAVATHETSLMLAAAAKGPVATVASTAEVLAKRTAIAAGSRPGQVADLDVETRQSRIRTILSRLSPLVEDAEGKEIRSVAAQLVQTTEPGTFEGLELELRRRIQRANEVARKARTEADQAAGLLAQLRGLQGPDVDKVVRELVAVERLQRPFRAELRQRVEALERACRERANREYAAEVVCEELSKLGYEVEEGFATLFVAGGTAQLQKAELKEYAVRMQVTPETGNLDVRLVRQGAADEPSSQGRRLRDREMEEAWCSDFARLLAGMGKRHISSRVVQRVRPGVEPVPIVAPTRSADRRRRRETPPTSMRQG